MAARALPGEAASGDLSLVKPAGEGCLVAVVVDGLGHGGDAASTARKAITVIERYVHEPPVSLVQRCHAELLGTRGVVMGLAAFDTKGNMTWVAVGNVEGVLVSADPRAQPPRTNLVTQGGIVGADLPRVRPWVVPVSQGDTLILATDGIRSGFAEGVLPSDAPQQLADHILARHARDNDDALVLVARYVGSA
ncbi:MAG: SpoIIE family protein phosphatase [Gemmatimonadetes bacterium]|nr:SpoIIE family protein phosphatase [Gemmatimonadota bacterium]